MEQFESPCIRSGLMNLKVQKEIKNITINDIRNNKDSFLKFIMDREK